MRHFTGERKVFTPATLMQELASDTVMTTMLFDRARLLGPGQYLEERVSPEHREILKNLKAEDIQDIVPWLLGAGSSQKDCRTCRYRFDKNGHQSCTLNDDCPQWDHWSKPTPKRFRQRSGVYCFGK